MTSSPRLALPYLAPQQSQKHVTVNEALRRLDAVVAVSARSATTGAEPPAPADGDAYILPAGKSGAAWSAMAAGALAAFQDGAWVEIAPGAGWRAFVQDTNEFVFYDGAAWGPVSRWGVNAAADAVNKLAVRSNAVLFDAVDAAEGGTGDSQVKVNKESAGDTASHLFQTGFSSRAEFGLTGDDDFHLKVSADGAAWTEALVVDKDNGNIGVGQTAPAAKLHLSGADSSDPADGDLNIDKQGTGSFTLLLLTTYASNVNNSPFSVQRKARGTRAAPADVLQGDRLGGFAFRAYKDNAWRQVGLIDCLVDAPVGTGTAPGALTFRTGAAGVTERMRISSAGDVGIGLTAPAVKLDVDGPVKVKSYAKAALPAASAGAGQIIYVSDEVGGATIAFSDGTNWRRVQDRAVVS